MGVAGSCSNQDPGHYQTTNEGTKRFFSPDYERDPCWNNHHRPFWWMSFRVKVKCIWYFQPVSSNSEMTCHSLKMAWKDGGDDDTPSVIATVSWKGGGTTSQVTTDQDRSLNHTLIWRIDNILYVQINVCGRYHCCLKWWLKPQKRTGEVAQLDGEGAVTGRALPPTIMCGGQKVLHCLFTSRRICSC